MLEAGYLRRPGDARINVAEPNMPVAVETLEDEESACVGKRLEEQRWGVSHINILTLLVDQPTRAEVGPYGNRRCALVGGFGRWRMREHPRFCRSLEEGLLQVVARCDGQVRAAVLVGEVITTLGVEVFETRKEMPNLGVVLCNKGMPAALLHEETPIALERQD